MNLVINKKYRVEEIINLFEQNGFKIDIYNGLRHNCRCGCGGKYYEDDKGLIKRIITKYGYLKLKYTGKYSAQGRYCNVFTKTCDDGKRQSYYIEFASQGEKYYADETNKKNRRCYTIYFELNKEVF